MKELMKCPQCGGDKFKKVDGDIYKCLYCGGTFIHQEQSQPVTQPVRQEQPKEHVLTICWEGMFFLIDTNVSIKINNRPYGYGSLVNGFTVSVSVCQNMDITLSVAWKAKSYHLSLNPQNDYEMHLVYSRTWGKFKDSYKLVTL